MMRFNMCFQERGRRFSLNFSEHAGRFELCIAENLANVQMDFGDYQTVTQLVGGEPYEEEYAVRPAVTQQTLPTKYKVMKEDLTIEEIPYAEVSNTSGGVTATIG